MYKHFCRNLKNFISINQSYPNLRLKHAEEIIFLTDVKCYLKLKKKNHIKYKQIKNFISQLRQYSKKYPALSNFIWELWAYGFDIERVDDINQESDEIMEEKAKLIDLLLSPQYIV